MYVRLMVDNGRVRVDGDKKAKLGSSRRMGPWANWKWDGLNLRAEVDRYGHYPLFWAATDGGVAVSDSIAELLRLGASGRFDDDAIAAFLRLGFFLGDDTPFKSIRAFPPSGALTWQVGSGVDVEGVGIKRAIDHSMTRSEAVDGFVERFRQAVSKSLPAQPERTALPLSGGRDSRHIAIELHRLGFRPGLVVSQRHFPSRCDDDADVAARVCAELGWPIEIVRQVANPVRSEIEKNRIFDCLTDEHAWFLPSAQRMKERGMTSVFDGIAGDVLSKGLFVREAWIDLGRTGNVAEWLKAMPAQRFGCEESGLMALLGTEFRQRWGWERALQRVTEEFSRHADDDDPVNSLMFWNRTRREIAPFLIRYLPGAEVITPYLDTAVFDFLWALPTRLLEDHRLHDEAIAAAAPPFAQLPFERSGLGPDIAGHNATMMRCLASRPMFWTPSKVLNQRWLLPRIAASLISPKVGRSAGWYAPWAVWLRSLEKLSS